MMLAFPIGKKVSMINVMIRKLPQVFLIELLLLHFEGSPKLVFLLLLSGTCNSVHNY